MKKWIYISLCTLFMAAGCLTDRITVSGTISVSGNEPFTYLRLITEEREEFKIVGPRKDELQARYQQQKVTLKARVVKEATGPGFPTEIEVIDVAPSN